jgi:hypothetical protein
LLAVDSRATGGMYIGSGSVKKIIEINKVRAQLSLKRTNLLFGQLSFLFVDLCPNAWKWEKLGLTYRSSLY